MRDDNFHGRLTTASWSRNANKPCPPTAKPVPRPWRAFLLSRAVVARVLSPTRFTRASPQRRVPSNPPRNASLGSSSPIYRILSFHHASFFFWENLLPNRNRLFENNLVEILYNFVVVKVSRIEFNVNVQRFVNMILKNDTCIYMIVFSLER